MTTEMDEKQIVFDEQATAPDTPSTGKVALYAKTDGVLYTKDDAGTENPIALSLPVSETDGGTGQTAYTAGDILYSDATNSLARLPIGTNGEILKIVTGLPSWEAESAGVGTVTSVGLSTDSGFLTVGSSPVTTSGTITLNKTGGLTANQVVATPDGTTGVVSVRSLVNNDLPIVTEAKGGTGESTYTTGDILYSDSSNSLAKRAIGTTGQVLTVSGGVPAWATPTAGSWTTITAWTAIGTPGTTIQFLSIPATYKHLRILLKANFSTGTTNTVTMRFNTDTTAANYGYQHYRGQATSTIASSSTAALPFVIDSGGSTANTWSFTDILIFDYLDSASQRVFQSFYMSRGTLVAGAYSGWWTNVANAISQIDLVTSGNNFTATTSYMLMGGI